MCMCLCRAGRVLGPYEYDAATGPICRREHSKLFQIRQYSCFLLIVLGNCNAHHSQNEIQFKLEKEGANRIALTCAVCLRQVHSAWRLSDTVFCTTIRVFAMNSARCSSCNNTSHDIASKSNLIQLQKSLLACVCSNLQPQGLLLRGPPISAPRRDRHRLAQVKTCVVLSTQQTILVTFAWPVIPFFAS